MLKKRSLPPEQSSRAARSSSGNLRWLLAGAILFPLAGVFLAWDQGPLLLRDFSLGEDLTPAKRFHLVDGRCRSRLVLYSCEIKVSSPSGSVPHELELKYMFTGLPFVQYSVRLFETMADPAVLTTDLGQQKLLNRAVTLPAMLLFCFSIPIAYLRARRRSELALQNGLLQRASLTTR